MPRQGRINIEGGIYHVIQRGIEKREIYIDDVDRREFLRRLEDGLKKTGHKCYGWVLMPNHFHLLIRTAARPLSDLMRKLLTGYALYFNKKHKRSGYLYQGRYKSILCQEESYLLELVRYIHLNPLRAKIVGDMNRLSRYKWCGHSVLIGENKAVWQTTDEILKHFSSKRGEAVKKYLKYVSEAKGLGKRDDFTGGGLIRSAGGWKEVVNLRRMKENWAADERILGDGDFVKNVTKETDDRFEKQNRLKREGWTLEKLIEAVAEQYQIEKHEIKKKGRRNSISEAKSIIAYYANRYLGVRNSEVAEHFDCRKSAITRLIQLGEKAADKKPVKALF